jgi:hypothetical protein
LELKITLIDHLVLREVRSQGEAAGRGAAAAEMKIFSSQAVGVGRVELRTSSVRSLPLDRRKSRERPTDPHHAVSTERVVDEREVRLEASMRRNADSNRRRVGAGVSIHLRETEGADEDGESEREEANDRVLVRHRTPS